MQIVPQSAKPPAFPFSVPTVPLLVAPRIAGLLPAPQTIPPPLAVDHLRLHDPRLSQLTSEELGRVSRALQALLTAAVDFTLGESLSAELAAAELVFHECLTGEVTRPRTNARAGLKQRLDAFWEESQARMAAAEVRIAAEVEALQCAHNLTPRVIDQKQP